MAFFVLLSNANGSATAAAQINLAAGVDWKGAGLDLLKLKQDRNWRPRSVRDGLTHRNARRRACSDDAAKPDPKVLFTSGYAKQTVVRQGLGANAWLKKPYTAAELAEKSARSLANSQSCCP